MCGFIVLCQIEDSSVYGSLYTGAIVGYGALGSLIQNCYNEGAVAAEKGDIGGIAGYTGGDIRDCINTGNVTSGTERPPASFIGGIVGEVMGSVDNCFNSGDIRHRVAGFTGGIAGFHIGYDDITNCYNIGNVTAEMGFAGGIAGETTYGAILNCANTGDVAMPLTSGGFTAGIVGFGPSVEYSYNTGNISGGSNASGIVGTITARIYKNYSAGNISGGNTSNSAIATLISGATGVAYNYWRTSSAPRAVDSYLGPESLPARVNEDVMKSESWITNTLGSPYILDPEQKYNSGYPILSGINYDPTFLVAADESEEMISGAFNYQSYRNPESGREQEDYTSTYYYSDSYFSESAYVYNQSLATMSLCLALSAFGSNEGGMSSDRYDPVYMNKAKNAVDLLGQIGFEDIEANYDFTVKPDTDSIGLVMGHKSIVVDGEEYTLITVAARGGGYEAEWAGNFTIGAFGRHEGFAIACEKAYWQIVSYIENCGIRIKPNIKLWLTGFSRAGAAMNLLAGRLTDDISIAERHFTEADLYDYCFEPPMGALEDRTLREEKQDAGYMYANIHNIVNPGDLVPKVAPAAWEFDRYGTDENVIPKLYQIGNAADYAEMLIYYNNLDTEYVRGSVVSHEGKEMNILDTFRGADGETLSDYFDGL